MKKLILASASPRRRELLAKAGFDFEVMVSLPLQRANKEVTDLYGE